jgi:site-specific DNA-methyltransferase (adenine-specific)
MMLLNDDCLRSLPNLPEKQVDLILADLPYGITQAKWDCEIPLDKLWPLYERVAKPTAAIVLFASQPFTSKLILSKLEWFKYCWYWEKEKGTGFLNAKHQPLRCVEEICVFYQKSATYNPQMVELEKPRKRNLPTSSTETVGEVASFGKEIEYKIYTHAYPKNLLRFGRDKGNKGVHSTQKPLALIEYLVKTHSNEGDLVLDNVMGSGTTGVACKNLGREFIGIEIDPPMFEIAKQRIESAQKESPAMPG